VMPMGVRPDYRRSAHPIRLTNIRGAPVTMPHKVTTVALLDESRPQSGRGPATRFCAAPAARSWATCSTGPGSHARRAQGPADQGALVVRRRRLRDRGLAAAGLAGTASSTRPPGAHVADPLPEAAGQPAPDPAGWDIVINATPWAPGDGCRWA
jgi:shikimate dehydrogenase